MTQHLTEKDVRSIAEYARIGLTDEEVSSMTVDLNSIIESLKPITEYDLEGVEPTFHPIGGLVNVSHEDIEGESFSQKTARKMPQNSRMAVSSFLLSWAGVMHNGSLRFNG